MNTIGQRIKAARERLGMTQTQLADKVNITSQLLYKYEHDFITNIPSDKIEEISRVLGIAPAILMGWDIPRKTNSKDCYIKLHFGELGEPEVKIIDFPFLNSEEEKIIQAYRNCDDSTKIVVKRILSSFIDDNLEDILCISNDDLEDEYVDYVSDETPLLSDEWD